MSDHQAWRDWDRVEDCLLFGIRRWIGFVIAAFLIDKYLKPMSEPFAAICDMLAFGITVMLIRRQDAARQTMNH